ncbi:MAG: hypothetical protein QXJ94_04780 [Candidatus Bathyarchaeia archaeon]
MGSVALRGWFRDKDEKIICQEGYQKKQKTSRENQEDLEVAGASTLANHCFT